MREIQTQKLEEFLSDPIAIGFAERQFQVAIQAALDIGSILLAAEAVDIPAEYRDIFPKLGDLGILPPDFASRLVPMAKYRNILVHLYLSVDPVKTYDYLHHHLDDFALFARYVGEYLSRQPAADE